jgi:hypothetical protein
MYVVPVLFSKHFEIRNMGLFSVQQLRPLIIIIEVNLLLEMNENNQLYL